MKHNIFWFPLDIFLPHPNSVMTVSFCGLEVCETPDFIHQQLFSLCFFSTFLMCMWVCVHTTHTHIHIHTYKHTHIYTHIHICTHIYTPKNTHIHNIHIHACTHTCTHAHAYTYTCIHMCTLTHMWRPEVSTACLSQLPCHLILWKKIFFWFLTKFKGHWLAGLAG